VERRGFLAVVVTAHTICDQKISRKSGRSSTLRLVEKEGKKTEVLIVIPYQARLSVGLTKGQMSIFP